MASFKDHLSQAKENLRFLENICHNNKKEFWDWKVTVSFYTAVHLVNAHIADKTGQHYRTHEQVLSVINPNKQLSPCKLSEEHYLAFVKLRNLSRRARYLVHEKENILSNNAHFTYDKHFAKAIRNLDLLISLFAAQYSISIPQTAISCIELTKVELLNFQLV